MSDLTQQRKPRFLANLALFTFSLFFALLVGEIAVRILFPAKQRRADQKVFVHELSDNLRLLYKPSPNTSNNSYNVPNQINSGGFRDREFPIAKAQGTKRILFIGDSVVYGYGITLDETLAKQLESQFKQSNKKIEVLNFGVSGYETEQAVEFLKEVGLQYQPDLVLAGYTLNDSNYASWELDLFESNMKSKISAPTTGYRKFLAYLYTHSRLLALLDQRIQIQKRVKELRAYQNIPIQDYLRERNEDHQDAPDSEYRGLKNKILEEAARVETSKASIDYLIPTVGLGNDDLRSSHWNISKKAFQELKALGEQHHFKVVAVIFPLMQEMDKYPLQPLHDFLDREFKEIGLPVINLMSWGIETYKQVGIRMANDPLHFSGLGSASAAKHIKEILDQGGYL